MSLAEALNALTEREIREIVAGTPFRYEDVPDEAKERLVKAAIHCCCNGPVSVHKRTTFYGIREPVSIDDLVGHRVTNSQWAGFCRDVAAVIPTKVDIADFPWVIQTGGLWPLAVRQR